MNSGGSAQWIVERCSTVEILPLRTAVLRDGTPSRDARYDEDDMNGTVHLAVRSDGDVVATSTWITRPWPHDELAAAVQLRGMAVAKHLQGRGLGSFLLAAGVCHAKELGAKYVWARARDSALYFYDRHGFVIVGDEFIDETSGFSHHLVVQSVTRNDV